MSKYFSKEGLPAPALPSCQAHRVLAGQKALVTGANSGIGRAVAIALGRAGADVLVNYYSGEEAAHEVEAPAIAETVDLVAAPVAAAAGGVAAVDEDVPEADG